MRGGRRGDPGACEFPSRDTFALPSQPPREGQPWRGGGGRRGAAGAVRAAGWAHPIWPLRREKPIPGAVTPEAPAEAGPGCGAGPGRRRGAGGAGIFPGKGKLGAPARFGEALTQPLWAPRPCLRGSAAGSGNAALAPGNHGGAFDTGAGDGARQPRLSLPPSLPPSFSLSLLLSLSLSRQSPWAGSSVRLTQRWHHQVFH
ncbi:uncharacterized protein LOC143695126 [Agelaius phoeniceus]|uniref:uncharacterized protein LOC143695126 n=1 Tax=Agelaius phoeniceus TaxID=39638 RepID=UPI004054F493